MWPLEHRRDVLRVGRDSVELWRDSTPGLTLQAVANFECAGGPQPADLERCVAQALREGGAPGGRSARRIDVVIESAWLPAMAFDVGAPLSTRGRVESLLRHRMGELHEPREPFELRVDYCAGDGHALGYALAPAVRRAVIAQLVAADRRVASVQPAFAWGWARLARHRRRNVAGWWSWSEQDRSIVAHWRAGRVVTLNAGAVLFDGTADIVRAVDFEAICRGVLEDLAVVHVDWHRDARSNRADDLDAGSRLTHVLMAAPTTPADTPALAKAHPTSAA